MNALGRRALAEFVGTGMLVAIVVGSGIAATRLTHDSAVRLLVNSTTTALGLGVLVLVFLPVSGAHLNPVVTGVDWLLGRREDAHEALVVMAAQVAGALGGAVLADAMFGVRAVALSHTHRTGGRLVLSEVVATAGLLFLVVTLVRTGRVRFAPAAVGAYIGAAYWFTSSTSFANPAVTIGRMITDTYAGIAPGGVLPFLGAQVAGGALGAGLAVALYPLADTAYAEAKS